MIILTKNSKVLLIFLLILNNLSAKNINISYKKSVYQGESIYFASREKFDEVYLLSSQNKPLINAKPFNFEGEKEKYYVALIPITPMIKEGKRNFQVIKNREKFDLEVEILKYDFKEFVITLTPQKGELITKPSKEKKEQALVLINILNNLGDTKIYHYDKFIKPIKDKYVETSSFGERRIFRTKDKVITGTTMHNGNDFAAKIGTPVFAAGRGKVVFARERLVSGNTIILQHLPGVYTLYFHLSSIIAKEDSIVNTGELIGKIGDTGLVTGPHLHWELRINGVAVNSNLYLENMLIDKNQIMNMIILGD